MPEACFCSLIESTGDGRFIGSIPDLPSVTVTGSSEDEVVRGLTRRLRNQLEQNRRNGESAPAQRTVSDMLRHDPPTPSRRLMLLIV